MRFKQFLEQEQSSSPWTESVSNQEAIEWMKTHSRAYIDGKRIFFRGMQTGERSAEFGDTSTFTRKSKNTDNYYTLMIQSSPTWEAFPSRSRAFISSSSVATSERYGNDLFAVFPEDNTTLGVCPTYDIWQSFNNHLQDYGLNSLRRFNEFLNELALFRKVKFTQTDPKIFREQLQWFDIDNLKKIKEEGEDQAPFGKWEAFGHTLTALIKKMEENGWPHLEIAFDHILDPDDNKFFMCKAKDWAKCYRRDVEIWFSGKAMFIPVSFLNSKHPFGKMFEAEFGWI